MDSPSRSPSAFIPATFISKDAPISAGSGCHAPRHWLESSRSASAFLPRSPGLSPIPASLVHVNLRIMAAYLLRLCGLLAVAVAAYASPPLPSLEVNTLSVVHG